MPLILLPQLYYFEVHANWYRYGKMRVVLTSAPAIACGTRFDAVYVIIISTVLRYIWYEMFDFKYKSTTSHVLSEVLTTCGTSEDWGGSSRAFESLVLCCRNKWQMDLCDNRAVCTLSSLRRTDARQLLRACPQWSRDMATKTNETTPYFVREWLKGWLTAYRKYMGSKYMGSRRTIENCSG